jgi:Ca2+-binding RTX toxin-like protein
VVSTNGVDILEANSGNDTLTGGSGTDTLESGVGNTLMNGGSGTETYLFNTGFGQDTLVANDNAASNTILFGAGITVSDLQFSTDGSELVITATNSNGSDGQASSITLPGHFVNGSPVNDVGELDFSDGSYVTMAQINQLFASPSPAPSPTPTTVLTAGSNNTLVSDNGIDLLEANSGNDTLTGGSNMDTLESGVGNTLMNGGSGAETYLFNTGFGQDTIVANGSATSNTIQFGSGITVSDLEFSTDGSELVITDTSSNGSDGQSSSITLPDHFVNGSPVTDVGELVFSDGSYVTMAQINQLFASSPSPSPSATPAIAPMEHAASTSRTEMATTSSARATFSTSIGEGSNEHQMMIPENAMALQLNPLIHAMASFGGASLAADEALSITHKVEGGLMLHVAA